MSKGQHNRQHQAGKVAIPRVWSVSVSLDYPLTSINSTCPPSTLAITEIGRQQFSQSDTISTSPSSPSRITSVSDPQKGHMMVVGLFCMNVISGSGFSPPRAGSSAGLWVARQRRQSSFHQYRHPCWPISSIQQVELPEL